MDHHTKVTLLLTTFHSLLLLVNACCPHPRQHHSTATLRVVCVPGLRTGLTGLTGQDTEVLLVAFSLVLALITHQAHVSITFEIYQYDTVKPVFYRLPIQIKWIVAISYIVGCYYCPDPAQFRLVSFDKMLTTMKRRTDVSVAICKAGTCFRLHQQYT